MGHLAGKDLYRKLGEKIDGLTARAPWNETFHALLRELYSEEDAELIARMPYGLSRLERLERVTGIARPRLQRQLESLCPRGLVLDVCIGDTYYYAPSPLVIGIFEFTMMRTSPGLDHAKWARLFHEYMEESPFYAANFGAGQQVSVMRAVPHDGTVASEPHVEILDYEKATAIVESSDRFAMGLCSCRHERQHLGEKRCQAPLGNCTSFGVAADYLVRNGLAREVSKSEAVENVARSRELGLVLNADNVQRNVTFMCHCCKCCCNALKGISKHGFPHAVVTSSYLAASDRNLCKGCGKCSKRCPIEAIPRVPDPDPRFRKHGRPKVDESLCLGCGVCALGCNSGAMKLHPRAQRVLHPETTFERIMLGCLERGTLQNQLFDDPGSKRQAFLRAVVGGFLRLPPVKQALMSDALRSQFLAAIRSGAARQGKRDLTEV
jgi:ferredoxin